MTRTYTQKEFDKAVRKAYCEGKEFGNDEGYERAMKVCDYGSY